MNLDQWLLSILIALLALLLAAFTYGLFLRRRWLFLTRRWREGYDFFWPYSSTRELDLLQIIERAERESGVRLTSRARTMLPIPVIEQMDEGRPN